MVAARVPNIQSLPTALASSPMDLYDPAWPKYQTLPNKTWHLVLCFDVLPFVPESDIDSVLDLLNNITEKICIIGLQPIVPHKSKKPFVCIKDYKWWQEKISSRQKLILVWNTAQKPFAVSDISV